MKMRVLIALLLSLWASISFASQVSEVSVDRAWGLLIGDMVNVKVTLPVAYEKLDVATLPQVDKRYGTWLYLASLKPDSYSLQMTYQVVNVPTQNEKIEIPELSIRTLDDDFVTIPAVKITIGSLLPNSQDAGANKTLQADRTPILEDTSFLKRELWITGLITLVLVSTLVLWHLGWRFKNRRPFAQAVHDLSRLRWSRSAQPNQAARILHAAFNATAGTIVVQNNIDEMMKNIPWMKPLASDIEAFYRHSEQTFFSRDAQKEPDLATVMKLAKACRSKEKLA